MAIFNPYGNNSSDVNYYNSPTNTRAEPDMRNEIIYTLEGYFPEIPKANNHILRKLRRDSNNNLILCPCTNNITKEPDKDVLCTVCLGVGYLWDEIYIGVYKVLEGMARQNAIIDSLLPAGILDVPIVSFYTKYNTNIDKYDIIIQVELNIDGSIKQPLNRIDAFEIAIAWEYRCDNGKLEYFKLLTHRKVYKYLNPPTYNQLK